MAQEIEDHGRRGICDKIDFSGVNIPSLPPVMSPGQDQDDEEDCD